MPLMGREMGKLIAGSYQRMLQVLMCKYGCLTVLETVKLDAYLFVCNVNVSYLS
jgi:hypothetical protein